MKNKEENEFSLSPLANKIFSVKELCKELQISRQTIYNWEKNGYVKPKMIGSRKYFLGKDLLEQLNPTTK
jgi:predicted site-specific integrase-resolvase